MGASAGDLLAAAAASLRPELPSMCAAMVAQLTREMPELAVEQTVEELLIASVNANVSTALDFVEAGALDSEIQAPPAAVEYARRLAQRGVAVTTLLRAYRLGQGSFQQELMKAIAAVTEDPEAVIDASMRLSTIVFDYIDRASEQIVSAYQLERDRWMRNRGALRSARVMSVLAGGTVNIDDTEKSIGYPLRQTHRAAVVWIDDSATRHDPLIHLERVVSRLVEYYGVVRAPLVIAPDDSTVWAWLPVPATTARTPNGKGFETDDGTWVALGDTAQGVEGFRLTHRQARQAQIAAMAADANQRARITESAQIGVVALMCADLDAVQAWVQKALGGLAADDDATARLRETVRAFFASGGSHTATAQELMLHKNTVQYRIRKAEQTRGRPFSQGRLDAEVALLAAHVLGRRVLQPPSSLR